MTDFTKTKIFFALAMVGFILAINQIEKDHGYSGYSFFGLSLQFRFLYLSIISLLGCAVYLFALGFVTEDPPGITQKIGNFLYTFSLSLLPIYLMFWGGTKIAELIVIISKSKVAGLITGILGFTVYIPPQKAKPSGL